MGVVALAYVAGKSGLLSALDPNTGLVSWTYDFKPYARNGGGIGTPTGDGTMIMVSGGKVTAGTPPGCTIGAFDLAGTPLYMLHAADEVTGAAAFVPGIGFLGLDQALVAFDSYTGATLWTSPNLGATMHASPAVVRSGVYIATLKGIITVFSPNAGLPSSSRKRP